MKRPCDQAKLFFLALLRSTAALATESSKIGTSTMSSVKIFPATAAASSASSSSAASSSAATTSRWIQLRLARRTDVPSLQRCNLATLPENYNSQFYLNHLRTWPDLALVCEALPLNYNQDDAPPQNANGNNHKLASLWGGASRPFQAEPNIVAYVLGKIEEDEDYYDDDEEGADPSNNHNDDEEWIDNDDAYYAAWSKPSLLRFRNANPSHRALSSSSSSSSSNSMWSRQEEEDLIQELSSSSRQRGSNNSPSSRSQQQQQPRRPRRHRLRGHVTSLAVLPEYRRLGLAASLMKQLHHHLTTTTSFNLEQPLHSDNDGGWDTTRVYENDLDKKITRVGLHVRKSNTAACSLYQRDGYEVTRVISNYYQDGEDAFYMTKALVTEEATKSTSNNRPQNNNNKSPPPQQRLWGGGRGQQRWRVSSPQDRKDQQQQHQAPRQAEESRSSSKTSVDEFQLPRFIDLEVERQEYLRQKEAAAAAAAATTTTTSRSANSINNKPPVEQHHHVHDHDDEPELLTGTM